MKLTTNDLQEAQNILRDISKQLEEKCDTELYQKLRDYVLFLNELIKLKIETPDRDIFKTKCKVLEWGIEHFVSIILHTNTDIHREEKAKEILDQAKEVIVVINRNFVEIFDDILSRLSISPNLAQIVEEDDEDEKSVTNNIVDLSEIGMRVEESPQPQGELSGTLVNHAGEIICVESSQQPPELLGVLELHAGKACTFI